MIVCVDFDGTISADPEFFRAEMAGLRSRGHQVHVLSAAQHGNATPADLDRLKKRLAALGFAGHYDAVAMVDGPHKAIPKHKVAYMRKVHATHLVDNRKGNCRAAVKAGFTAHHQILPRKNP